jgi:large subunit ribosomal protein L29
VKDSFSDLSYGELLTRRDEIRKQYRDVRFNLVVGHVDNPLLLRTLKRKVARLNTIVHEYDLRIRQAEAGAADGDEVEQRSTAEQVEAKE